MAFFKTNAAIATQNLTSEDAHKLIEEPFPANPAKGDTHEGFVWDGGSWIPLEVWAARQTSGEGEA